MKRIKQLAAILLSAILAAALAAPARIHASEGRFTDTKGEIVLEGIDGDQTFRIYKILDLVSFSDDDTDKDRHWSDRYAYAIAENSLWLPFVRDHEDIFDVSDHWKYEQNARVKKTADESGSGLSVYPGEEMHNHHGVLHTICIGGKRAMGVAERNEETMAACKSIFDELCRKFPNESKSELLSLAEALRLLRQARAMQRQPFQRRRAPRAA